ncbi:MAG: methyltransferase regulatory domain-containing protein [Acidobacteria bacterium]|nr:methyltransferase regulatory domain-containing protein [Acidobacteriota bacterium]MBI3655886.1 methyltransferase regulatory domain-containing protein [Acidobacteriota bacterium]
MSKSETNAYDDVAYAGYPLAQTHPDRLATLATLFGMKPARVACCRVLELGCGDGGNLIAMAFNLPQSEFSGIDLAPGAIAKGQALVEKLALKNIVLRHSDLMQVEPDFGEFDYIIAHGVYSWIPPAVQDKLLEICRNNLATAGVAYVSYNTFPGGHLRNMVREMIRFHVRDLTDPQQKIQQALVLAKFLAESSLEMDTYRLFLKEELKQALSHDRGALYHDELAQVNSSVYFYEFSEHARRHGLQFLGEADFFEMQDHIYTAEVSATLQAIGRNDLLLKEQYLDFLKCRRFRQTLLCRAEVPLDRGLKPEILTRFYLASPARPMSAKPDLIGSTVEEFRGVRGAAVATDFPLAKAALVRLGEIWPQLIPFSELLSWARLQTGIAASSHGITLDRASLELCEILLHTYKAGLIELHVFRPEYAAAVSERPMASRLARLQVESGDILTNLRHTSVRVEDEIGRQLLRLLDGTRDHATLLRDLSATLSSDDLRSLPVEEPLPHSPSRAYIRPEELEENLAKLARLALLST